MEQSEKVQQHRQKMSKMRQNLKVTPIMRKVTLPVQNKIEKSRMRRKSANLEEPLLDKSFADSDSERQEGDTTDFDTLYVMGDKIGEGAHGVVRKCYLKQNNELFAVKSIVLDQQHILYLRQNFIDIKKLKHPNIISYKAIFFEIKNDKCHLIMDYLPYPDLLHIKISTERQLKEIIYQIVQTLVFIHRQKICHRDIKPENILFDPVYQKIIIVDFGISKKLIYRNIKKDMLTLTGTPYYRAPEMFAGGGYNELVDMWALGITVYKLMTGVTPFESEYHSETIKNITQGLLIWPPQAEARYSRQARMFVAALLTNRLERLTASEALKDLWFIDVERSREDIIRSTTMSRAYNHQGAKLQISMNGGDAPLLQRNNTSVDKGYFFEEPKSRQEIIKSLKSLQGVEEEDSMIYGITEEDTPKLFGSFK